ncbi:TetR/AcrR family transcriptional regulator [Fodinicola acaciae]|uniref:TetR/AcrR family transcriptional regulator n=1 Tax=Fodinicola acaciae TaxID=2681555 RepID=UPI0013D6AA11|nr:TetR/AcrR family transcriptional regulator [Fodinicola acaciae]
MATSARRPGRPPNSDGAATKERLLDAALELFARQGYAATTVRQIGVAADVTDSAIYGHFAGKQAIYDALFAAAGPMSAQSPPIEVDALAATPPAEAIPRLVDEIWTQWCTPRARRFLRVMLQDGSGAAGVRGLTDSIEATRDLLRKPFERWQSAGLLRSDVPARQLVWELFAPLQVPRVLHLHANVKPTDLAAARKMVDDHVAFFLAAALVPERCGNASRRARDN